MEWQRRQILGGAVAVLGSIAWTVAEEKRPMYGLIVKMVATAGKREELISLLLQGTAAMPGCLSYIIARDAADDDGIWVTEVWDDKASHDASLSLPVVQKTIAAARPMIAAFNNPVVTTPIGGQGLPVAKHAN
jgi:quinol monooxygenase YgiN